MNQPMTKKQFQEAVNDLKLKIKENAVAFTNDTPDKQLARVKEAKRCPVYFISTYFPHYATCEMAPFQREELDYAVEILRSDKSSITAEIWARGFGKTTLFAIALPIWAALNGLSKFTIYVGADRELSKERTVAVRLELQYNARIINDFPEIAMDENVGEEKDFNAQDGSRFLALGYMQSIRGKVNRQYRPRLIVVDDLESHKDTKAKTAQKKYDFVTEEAFGAFGGSGGLILWLGNLTNSESALNRFVKKCENEPENEYIRCRIVRATNESGNSTWPAMYTNEKLKAIGSVMGKTGFNRHYLMRPGIDGDIFKEDWIRHYNPYNPFNPELIATIENAGFNVKLPTIEDLKQAVTITYCDPSLGGGETNDYKGIATISQYGGLYYERDIHLRKESIIDMLRYMYELDKRYKTRHFMEKNFWQKIIWQYLPKLAEEYGYMLPIVGVDNRLNKNERILTLEPLYQWGHILHTSVGEDADRYKEQLVGFPNADYDDGPDAVAGAIEQFKRISHKNQYETVSPGAQDYRGMF